MRRYHLGVLLALASVLAPAPASASTPALDGSFRIGMRRAEFTELARPLRVQRNPDGSSGILDGEFGGIPASLVFRFDGQSVLWSIEGELYRGGSLEAARDSMLALCKVFEARLGGVDQEADDARRGPFNSDVTCTAVSFDLFFDRVLPPAVKSVKEQGGTGVIVTFNVFPRSQPSGRTIGGQFVHDSGTGEYRIIAYQDSRQSPPRKSPAMLELY